MKLDNYITHLELKRKGLKIRCKELLMASDKIKIKRNVQDPNYNEIQKIRSEITDINNKLIFLLSLKKGVVKSETDRVQEIVKGR